jgi:hypothetical protein
MSRGGLPAMNKKGSVIHWIIFGILAGFGIFFVLRVDTDIEGVTGKWQADFLEDYYLEAEKDLLVRDQAAKFAGWQTVLELGEKGGFVEGSCESMEDYSLWNGPEGWCVFLPDIKEVFSMKVKEKLKIYSEIKTEGKDLIGKGNKETIMSPYVPKSSLVVVPYVKYIYDTSFRVDLGYDFDEYEEILGEAQDLVSECKDNTVLEECIGQEMKSHWKLKDCNDEEYWEEGRKVLFCVESKSKVINSEGELVLVEYRLALDFNN